MKYIDENGLLYLWQKIKSIIPSKVSDLTNDSKYQTDANVKSTVESYGYQTKANVKSTIEDYGYQTSSQVSTAISNALADVSGISYSIVSSLPSTGEPGIIYLKSNGGVNPNIYDEYIYVGGKFEKIGTTDVDLSGYVQTSDLTAITNGEIDEIVN